MQKLGYILGWLIMTPIIVVGWTVVCPFVALVGCLQAAKNGWPNNYGLTPPPKEVIILN